jgi:hypothetical protein
MPRRAARPILIAAIALLLIVASRISSMSIEPEGDEINNIYLSIGTPAEIVARTPYDWVPGGFLLMGGWINLVGLHPLALRWLPLFAFMLGCAFTYRLLLRWRGQDAALLGMLAYAALGLHIFLSVYMRGYAYALALLPCALWLTTRYFAKPTLRRALMLALAMAAMFYSQLTSALAFSVLGLYTLLAHPRAVWRWWLPAVIALPLALPEIQRQSLILDTRLEATASIQLPPLPQAYVNLMRDYFGVAEIAWVAVLIVAVGVLLWRERPLRGRGWLLLLWALGAPVVMYLLNPFFGLYSGRYSWWIGTGIALVAAWGLAWLPRAGRIAAGLALAVLCFAPLGVNRYLMPSEPLFDNLRWLAGQYRAGDVIVRDSANTCGVPEKWDVYSRVLFPQGVQFSEGAGDARRVWFVTFDGQATPALLADAQEGRYAGRFVGRPGCLIRLYEAPPDSDGVPFENGLRFHGMDVIDNVTGTVWGETIARREGEALRLRLWWSADRPVEGDYSVGVYLLANNGAMLAQVDSAPQVVLPEGTPMETSRWSTDTMYVEERVLTMPTVGAMGMYRLALAVYGWWDNARIAAAGVGDDGTLPLGAVYLVAW